MFPEGIFPMMHPANTILVAKNYGTNLSKRYERYDNLAQAYADADENNPDMQIILFPGTHTTNTPLPFWKCHLHMEAGAVITDDGNWSARYPNSTYPTSIDPEETILLVAPLNCLSKPKNIRVTGSGAIKTRGYINRPDQWGVIHQYPISACGIYTPFLSLNFQADLLEAKGAAVYFNPAASGGSTTTNSMNLGTAYFKVREYIGAGTANVIDADGNIEKLEFDGGYVHGLPETSPPLFLINFALSAAASTTYNKRPRMVFRNMFFETRGEGNFVYYDDGSSSGTVVMLMHDCRFLKHGSDTSNAFQVDMVNAGSYFELRNCAIEVPSAASTSFGVGIATAGGPINFLNTTCNKPVGAGITETTALTVTTSVPA